MSLLERLRAALHPDYDIEAPLAEGGMGIVFRARDVQLERPVAVKVLRPELATARHRERFLREARTLAGFRHPHIVSVHRAGEADGLAWYAMDLLEGETLADRLAPGPLPAAEALALADQVLGALEAVHARGVVHRDIKPSNIFLTGGGAVVGDFGIAKSISGEATAVTEPGHMVGTPGYMPPEQATGGEVSARTDVCAVGMLLYQMLTGRSWLFDAEAPPDWAGVPARLRAVMARALAWDPQERFAGAAEMRAALDGTARARVTPVRAGVAVAAVAAVAWLGMARCPRAAASPTLAVEIHAFQVQGGPSALGDSLAREVVTALRAAPEIAFRTGGRETDVDVHVTGSITVRGDTLTAEVRGERREHRAAFTLSAIAGRTALVDSLARQLMLAIWTTEGGALAVELPRRAMPRTSAGAGAWMNAEILYARAQWGAADTAYELTLALDSTCYVCDLRLAEISRWLRQELTTERTGRLVTHVDSFPPAQQAIIRAWVAPRDRWNALDEIARRWPGYAVGLFTVADEYFHRGPLVGERRQRALGPFRRATALRPAFAPAWEHFAWVAIAEGEREAAAEALGRYAATAAGNDLSSQVLGTLLKAGFLWRFAPAAVAAESTAALLANPLIQGYPDLPVGPLYLMSFDAPEGVVWLGERFTAWPGRPDLVVPGLVGQMIGLAALGRPAAAHAVAERLRAQSDEAEYALAAGAFDVALALDDSLRSDDLHAAVLRTLEPLTAEGAATPDQRRRGAWLLAVAARLAGDDDGARRWRMQLGDESGLRPMGALLDAMAAAAPGGNGGARRALALTAPLLALDSAGRGGDPLFRALLHLARADWRLAVGEPMPAVHELRWHENNDVVAHAGTVMQSAGLDWALGTWARWRRAQVLERSELGREEACRALDDVVRLWQDGEPLAARRAAEARARRADLGCVPRP